ncbi:MAG: DUF2334 domain-containing protein [Thermoplasmatales archaeon]|nr:DUF2334 domain-containing protein [Thermoplasmatales archaeon]
MRKLNITLYVLIVVAILYVFLIYIAVINPESSQYTYNDSVFEKQGDKKIIIAFRNDDLSVNSNLTHEESVLNIFWKYGIKQTFAFIPKRGVNKNFESNSLNEKAPILEALENWSKEGKIELALHGYTHQRSEGSSGEFDGLPYDSQLGKITDGKRIIDKIFNINVNMFAPPWNQADNNTVKACLNSGIHIFSGYLGEIPADGMTFVNTNAVLFPKANPMGEGTGLPHIENVLKYANNGNGTTFVIVFYHSRSDFNKPDNYSYVDNLLKGLTNDPSIEVSSIGEIAEKYKDLLPAYNQAGLNIKEAGNAKNRAKPYVITYRKVNDIIGGELSIDRLYDDAFIAYWSGNYEQASKLASKIIARCDNYIVYGRIMAIVGSGAVFLLFLGAVKYKRPIASSSYYRSFLWISIMPFLAVGGFLNIFRPVSAIRIEEFNIVLGLYVGGILIQYFLLKILDIKRKT